MPTERDEFAEAFRKGVAHGVGAHRLGGPDESEGVGHQPDPWHAGLLAGFVAGYNIKPGHLLDPEVEAGLAWTAWEAERDLEGRTIRCGPAVFVDGIHHTIPIVHPTERGSVWEHFTLRVRRARGMDDTSAGKWFWLEYHLSGFTVLRVPVVPHGLESAVEALIGHLLSVVHRSGLPEMIEASSGESTPDLRRKKAEVRQALREDRWFRKP